jgi:hypothetical protein
MVWDASRGRIYAALPGTSANGNSVVAIDPLTGTAVTPIPVGSDPNLLALSADASHLWVSLDGANAIQRVTLPGMIPDSRIDLPPSADSDPQIALAMQAAPVNPNTLAVILGNNDFSPRDTGGVAIYDGAVPRPTTVSEAWRMTWLQWGADDSTLYGQNGADTRFNFDVMNVDVSGARLVTDYGNVFPDFYSQSYHDRSTGRVYANDGRVFDPSTGALTGTFNLGGFIPDACLVDPVEPIVFFLGQGIGVDFAYSLLAFDKNTYRRLGVLPLPGVKGRPINLIRWGRAGVAFNTVPEYTWDRPAVYFVDGTFINSSADPDVTGGQVLEPLPVFTAIAPESAAVGSSDLVLTISGSEFQPTARVYWQGQPLATTFHLPTELQAVVPASKLAQGGAATIYVGNDSWYYSANSLTFTTLPASSGMIARNLSSRDIAWDAHSSRLYAPVWSADPRYANSIVAIDPATGSVSKVADAGADPIIVRISRDGTLGYIGYQISNLVTQFHVPALDSLMTWCLGWDSYSGAVMARDLQPAPDTPQTTAIALVPSFYSGSYHGLVIYDDGVVRPKSLWADGDPYAPLQWGLTDSVLYAADEYDLSTIGVDATGATLLRTDPFALTSSMIHFDRATGYLYADNGYATDPATGSHVGRYNASGLLVPDSSLNRVFILGQTTSQYGTGDYTITSFDQAGFTQVSSLAIRNVVGTPVAFTRWGASGLAFVTNNWAAAGPTSGPEGMLYILDNPGFVSATQQVQAGVENLAVGLTCQPSRASVSSSRRINRSTDSVGEVSRPYPKPGTRAPTGRQER